MPSHVLDFLYTYFAPVSRQPYPFPSLSLNPNTPPQLLCFTVSGQCGRQGQWWPAERLSHVPACPTLPPAAHHRYHHLRHLPVVLYIYLLICLLYESDNKNKKTNPASLSSFVPFLIQFFPIYLVKEEVSVQT